MAESLKSSVIGQGTPSWAEAWEEIQKAMHRTKWGEKPTFSHPVITEAVEAYDWGLIQGALAGDMPTISAQIRRIYEDIVKRSKEKEENAKLI